MTPKQFLFWQGVDLADELFCLRRKINRAAMRGRRSSKWLARADAIAGMISAQQETLKLAG